MFKEKTRDKNEYKEGALQYAYPFLLAIRVLGFGQNINLHSISINVTKDTAIFTPRIAN